MITSSYRSCFLEGWISLQPSSLLLGSHTCSFSVSINPQYTWSLLFKSLLKGVKWRMWDLALISSAFLKPFSVRVLQTFLCHELVPHIVEGCNRWLCSVSCGGIIILFVPLYKSEKLMPGFMFYCFFSKSLNFRKIYLKLEIFADLPQSGVSVSNCISKQ